MRWLAALLALAACGGSDAPARWHVARGFVRDPEGRAVILRGVNLAGAHKTAPYFSFHTEADFRRLRDDWGLNSVRFLIEWAAVEPASGQIDTAYLDQVAQRMAWADAAGLLVVLDMHQDIYGEGFSGGNGAPRWACDEARYAAFVPKTPWFLSYADPNVAACYDALYQPATAAHYREAWRRVAARLVSAPAVIGFDPMNEPYWGSAPLSDFEATTLQPFFEAIAHDVRSQAPDWLAFFEPSSSRNLGFHTGFAPFRVPDVVYAPHSYDQMAEGGAGFDPARRDERIANLASLATEASSLNAALWIGEYGGVASNPGIVPYMDAQYDGAAAVGAGSMYWAYDRGDGYALLNADGSEKAELLDVIVRPWPERVAGDDVRWSYDEATSTFTLTFTPDSSVHAPTVLSLPARRYPTGYQVACGGCTVVRAPGQALLTGIGGAAATVVVTP